MNYFFHIRNSTLFADEEGQAMQGEAVSAEAKAVALELIGEGYRGGHDRRNWRIEVADEAGQLVLNKSLEEAAIVHCG
jgi:hypothetical protein